MRAAYIEEHGSLNNIKIGDIPDSTCGENEVLIEANYAALNHLDLFVIMGIPGIQIQMPHALGADGSGIVREVGKNVSNVEPGDKVTINPGQSCMKCSACLSGQQSLCKSFTIKGEHHQGTIAEYFSVPAINVMKVPQNFPLREAAAAPLAYLTAWRMLTTKGGIKPTDFVFIQGASGGVSTCALQIAKLHGATVIASTSSEEKALKIKELGADHVVNYKEMPNYIKGVYNLTGKKGIDIVIDSVGAATFNKSIQMLRRGGKLISCGATTGPKTNFDISLLFWKQLNIMGSTMGTQKEFRDVMNLIFTNKLKVEISHEFDIENTKDALQLLSEGKQIGKIVVKIK